MSVRSADDDGNRGFGDDNHRQAIAATVAVMTTDYAAGCGWSYR